MIPLGGLFNPRSLSFPRVCGGDPWCHWRWLPVLGDIDDGFNIVVVALDTEVAGTTRHSAAKRLGATFWAYQGVFAVARVSNQIKSGVPAWVFYSQSGGNRAEKLIMPMVVSCEHMSTLMQEHLFDISPGNIPIAKHVGSHTNFHGDIPKVGVKDGLTQVAVGSMFGDIHKDSNGTQHLLGVVIEVFPGYVSVIVLVALMEVGGGKIGNSPVDNERVCVLDHAFTLARSRLSEQ